MSPDASPGSRSTGLSPSRLTAWREQLSQYSSPVRPSSWQVPCEARWQAWTDAVQPAFGGLDIFTIDAIVDAQGREQILEALLGFSSVQNEIAIDLSSDSDSTSGMLSSF